MSSRQSDFPSLFKKDVGAPLRTSVALRDYSNFRIGGPADHFFEAGSLDSLKVAIQAARRSSIPWYVIGGGFNLLFDDAGFRGLIVKNCVQGVARDSDGHLITALSGTPLANLVEDAVRQGLSGLEFLSGIPGTVGGAVFGNAGAFGQSIGECLEEAILLDPDGREIRFAREDFLFGYRHSVLKTNPAVLLRSRFRVEPQDKKVIKAKIEENLAVRARRHPPRETAYAGSYFKNSVRPDGTKIAAGYLLEQVGARELSFGGAAIYSGHCNFLINRGGATAHDVLALAAELKARVLEKFGIALEEEVMFLRAEPSMP